MRLRLVTVAILLAIASRGDGRPKHPDPLDSTKEASTLKIGTDSESRYTLPRRLSHHRRRDISITSVKFDTGRNKIRSIVPSLSFDGGSNRKNYLPLGALSSVTQRSNNRRSITRSANPSMISFLPSTPAPIPISIPKQSRVFIVNATSVHHERKLSIPTPIPIPVSIRGERKMMSRNLVKIVPQRLKPGKYNRRNHTKPEMPNIQLKNWPNEVVQNVQDLFNYEKYTSFFDDEQNSEDSKNKIVSSENMKNKIVSSEDMKNKIVSSEETKITNSREPAIKSPDIPGSIHWSKIPIVEATYSSHFPSEIDSSMHIDNLLGELQKKKINQATSQIAQNTVVHIMNAGSRKPNVTIIEPTNVNKVNKTKSGRPPQNVHIMFMMDKDGNQTSDKPIPPVEITGSDSDCPTITINSITQINNTIESKEGCTDLNIVINSHVLNTHVFKPGQTGGAADGPKDPYGTTTAVPSNNYQSNIPSNNNYYNYEIDKDPSNQPQADTPDSPVSDTDDQVSTLEVFQSSHINIGSNSQDVDDVPSNVSEDEDVSGVEGGDESAGANADGSALTDPIEEPGGTVASNPVASPTGQSTNPVAAAGDVGTAQANDAPAAISLPSLPNIPNIPTNQLSNLASNLGGGSNSGQTGLVPSGAADDDDDDDDILEAMSPVNLLESISSVFDYFNGLNPVNYGILGMAVAPFIAFAAGIVGVAAFLFPWAFPGSVVARSWNNNTPHIRIRLDPRRQELIHSSINQYKHANEWKGRRRKRKRRR